MTPKIHDIRDQTMYFDKFRVLNYFTPGLKIWSNLIPLRFDTYSGCSNFCRFCFARPLQEGAVRRMGKKYNPKILKIGNVKKLYKDCVRIFDNGMWDPHSYMDHWVYNRGLIENGTMGDPFLNEESVIMNTYNYMSIAQQYGIPLYFNSKMNALINDRVILDKFLDLKKTGAILDASIISHQDSLVKKFEPNAPPVTKRLKLLEEISDEGIDTIVSTRPIMHGITDVNFEEYIERSCQTGPKAIHLRTLVISGSQLKYQFWKDYAKASGMHFKDLSWRYPLDYFMDLLNRAKDVAKPYGVDITNSHTLFFESGFSNKCNYSKMSKQIQDGLFHPGLPDILHTAFKKRTESQLLTFDNTLRPALKNLGSFGEKKFKMDSFSATLVWASSCSRKIPTAFRMSGRNIIKKSMWDGWASPGSEGGQIRIGYISTINQIYAVVDGKKNLPLKDDNGHLMYAYLPKEVRRLDVPSTHAHRVPTVTIPELKTYGIW